jgi:hypothetical protein
MMRPHINDSGDQGLPSFDAKATRSNRPPHRNVAE